MPGARLVSGKAPRGRGGMADAAVLNTAEETRAGSNPAVRTEMMLKHEYAPSIEIELQLHRSLDLQEFTRFHDCYERTKPNLRHGSDLIS